jgi:potassium efflux system protein
MRFDRLIVALLFALMLAGQALPVQAQTSAPSATAQTDAPDQATDQTAPAASAPTQPSANPEPAEPVVSPVITEAEDRLTAAETSVTRLTRRVEENMTDDSTLVDLKLEAEDLARSMLDIGVSLRPRLTEVKARLEQLGPPPAEGEPAEPDSIIAEFCSLLAALVFVPGAYRLFGGLIDRDPN